MIRYNLSESVVVMGRFQTRDTVYIQVWNAVTQVEESILDADKLCVEFGTDLALNSGIFLFDFSNLVNYPTAYGSYLYLMKNQNDIRQWDHIIISDAIEKDTTLTRKLSTNLATVDEVTRLEETVTIYDDDDTTEIHKHKIDKNTTRRVKRQPIP